MVVGSEGSVGEGTSVSPAVPPAAPQYKITVAILMHWLRGGTNRPSASSRKRGKALGFSSSAPNVYPRLKMQCLGAKLRPGTAVVAHHASSPAIKSGCRTPLVSSSSSLCSRQCGLLPLRPQQRAACPRPDRSSSLQCSASSAVLAAASFDADSGGGSVAAAAPPLKKRSFPAFLAAIRAVFFYITTFVFAAPLFCFMLLVYPYVLKFDKYRRRAEHAINTVWAKLTTLFYYPVKIEGLENLPPPDQPAVYVANHLSFLDIYTLFHLHRDFKFISKTSNFLIPIIGWSMFLTGHVMINRVDRRSQLECLKQCGALLKEGASVLFFPEGTRSKDGRMHAFKKGAFSVAAKAQVPVVPITLVGTGDLMPNAREYLLYPGRVKVVIHPAIPASKNADALLEASYKAVASSLPPELVAPVDVESL